MTQPTLAEILEKPQVGLTISQYGLETSLYVDKIENRRLLSAHGLTLVYDKKEFEANPLLYTATQLEAHQNYHRLIKGDLSKAYRNLHSILDKESDVERIFQFVPEDTGRVYVEIAKIIVAPFLWLRFTTLKGFAKKIIQNSQLNVFGYEFIQKIVDYGNNFFKELKTETNGKSTDEVKRQLEECITVTGDLSVAYSRLAATAQKNLAADERMYHFLFPKDKLD